MAGYTASDVKLPGWNGQQVKRAVASILKYIGDQESKSNDLFDDEETLYLLVALKKMPMQSRNDKPVPLPLPHPLYSTEGAEICLFVKDHKGEGHKEAKHKVSRLEKRGGITKVIGLSKLRTKYESHEAKRALCKAYDLFLADERVLPALPGLIGKSFFRKKKQPIPIKLTAKDLPEQIRQACACTYLFKGRGTCMNIKVGTSAFSAAQLEANILAALAQAAQHIPRKWDNVQGVFIKTADSVALPLFQTLADQALKISLEGGSGAQQGSAAAKAGDSEEDEGAPALKAAAAAATGKKPKAVVGKAKAVAGSKGKPAPTLTKTATKVSAKQGGVKKARA